MTDFAFSSPDVVEVPTIPEGDLTVLGVVKGVRYARTHDGRELRIGKPLTSVELANRATRNEVRILTESRRALPGLEGQRSVVERELVRAWLVTPGEFERLRDTEKARAAAKAAAKAAKHTPGYIDAANLLRALDPVAPRALLVDVPADPQLAAMSRRGRQVELPGRGPVRGVEQIAEWLRDQGVELAATGEHLAVKARQLDSGTIEVIQTFEKLLAGWVAKRPVSCALSHTKPVPAWTLAVGGLPLCEQHMVGDRD